MDEKLNVTTVNRPARVEFVDLAKGITIMIMVMYHTGVGEPFYGAYSMIMIPVFYVTSGMFFKDYGGLKAFIVNRFHRLIVPFLIFYIGSYVLFYILKLLAPQLQTGTSTGILDVFKQRLWFDFPIWFMLALFVASIIFAAIHATLKKEAWRVVAVIAVGAAGVALGMHLIIYRPVNLIMAWLGIESAILGAVATILLCLACVPLFIRFLPFLFGRKTVQQPRG